MKKTKDLCLAATLISLDINPNKVEVTDQKGKNVAQFVFEPTENFLIAQKKYWDGQLRVEPRAFYQNLKSTKNRIYELINNPK